MMIFGLLQDNWQLQSYCTKFPIDLVIRNSHIQIVIRNTKLSLIDASNRGEKNDIKKMNCS